MKTGVLGISEFFMALAFECDWVRSCVSERLLLPPCLALLVSFACSSRGSSAHLRSVGVLASSPRDGTARVLFPVWCSCQLFSRWFLSRRDVKSLIYWTINLLFYGFQLGVRVKPPHSSLYRDFPVVSCYFWVSFFSVKSWTFWGSVLVWSMSYGSNFRCVYFSLSKDYLVYLNTIHWIMHFPPFIWYVTFMICWTFFISILHISC